MNGPDLDAMSEIVAHPLAPVLVGALFSAFYVPFVSRSWQNRQKDLDVRTALVTEMSQCIMRFVSELERWRASISTVAPRGALTSRASISRHYRQFDVERCVIGTRLEVHYPTPVGGRSIARDWGVLTDFLIELHLVEPHDAAALTALLQKVRDKVEALLGTAAVCAARETAAQRSHIVDQQWGEPEQLLLAEKLRLITAVRQRSTVGWRKTRRE